MRNRQKGFSLIELLIVVAIILIIAAIAIPNLMRSKMAANEASAVGSVRTIVTSQVTYSTTYGTGFALALLNLGGPIPCTATAATACLIDPVLSTGIKSGYGFATTGTLLAGTVYNGFEVVANPSAVGISGQRSFCSDQTGVVRFDAAGTVLTTGAGNCAAVVAVLGN